jgi:dTDP-4-dehydrorhamnose reductase
VGATLVHYSTDFVFDGLADQPYFEDAPTHPLSVYGASKLAGEVAVRSIGQHYILRLESLFGGTGVNGHRATVDQIAETILKGGTVRALMDRTVSPSYVPEVAKVSRLLLARQAPFGTYHCVTSGFTTWYELAQEVAAQLQVPATILAVTAADFQTPAARPQFCALSNKKLSDLGITMHSWRSALSDHLASRYIADAVTSVRARIA